MGQFTLSPKKPDPNFNTVFTITSEMEKSFLPFLSPEIEHSERKALPDGMIEIKINLSQMKLNALLEAVNAQTFKLNTISPN